MPRGGVLAQAAGSVPGHAGQLLRGEGLGGERLARLAGRPAHHAPPRAHALRVRLLPWTLGPPRPAHLAPGAAELRPVPCVLGVARPAGGGRGPSARRGRGAMSPPSELSRRALLGLFRKKEQPATPAPGA